MYITLPYETLQTWHRLDDVDVEVDEPLEVASPDAMVYVADFTQVDGRKRRSRSSSDFSSRPPTGSSRLYGSFNSVINGVVDHRLQHQEHHRHPRHQQQPRHHRNGYLMNDVSLCIDDRNQRVNNHYNFSEEFFRSQALLTITKSLGSKPGEFCQLDTVKVWIVKVSGC